MWLSSKLWLRVRAILAVKCSPKTEVTIWMSRESFPELVLLVPCSAMSCLTAEQSLRAPGTGDKRLCTPVLRCPMQA